MLGNLGVLFAPTMLAVLCLYTSIDQGKQMKEEAK